MKELISEGETIMDQNSGQGRALIFLLCDLKATEVNSYTKDIS